MGTVSIVGAIIIITGWVALVEFDSFPESKRIKIIENIKQSPTLILLIALLPIGIIIHLFGGLLNSMRLVMIGSSFILLQSIIVAFFLWNQKRWKAILLLIVAIGLGAFIYIPLFR